jgi:sigma-B regulation protein RsbU (phosphoserine phosphatase)
MALQEENGSPGGRSPNPAVEPARAAILHAQFRDRRARINDALGEAREPAKLVGLLQEVDAALERLATGTYGICEQCHEPIEDDYLRTEPLVRVCLSHLSEGQQRAMERDLDLASSIQANLLPPNHLRRDGWGASYYYEPAGPVSGDYCDIIQGQAENDQTFFLVGDVSGKGVAASLLMSQLHAIFRSLISTPQPIDNLLERANRLLSESTSSSHFATLVSVRAIPTGHVEICNAGHCAPLLVTQKGVTAFESTGLPLGIFFRTEYQCHKALLEPGNSLLLYTDGLTEARNSSDQEYGEERLKNLAAASRSLQPEKMINAILKDLDAFRGVTPKSDDLTMLVLRRTA